MNLTTPQPCAAVIGPGRVGRALCQFYQPPIPVFGRSQQLPPVLQDVPIWVCTTNDGLDHVLQYNAPMPAQQRQLIFLQNGMLLPWLRRHQLQHNTQLLLYMSASEDGRVTDGRRSAVWGPWSHHVATVLTANGVACSVVDDWGAFQQRMLAKLLWSCIFWLLSAGLGGEQVGVLAQQHSNKVEQLVAELLPLGQAYLRSTHSTGSHSSSSSSSSSGSSGGGGSGGGSSDGGSCHSGASSSGQQEHSAAGSSSGHELQAEAVMEQLLSYSLAISSAVPSVDMARREFAWRNGFFLGLPQGKTPAHCDWLVKAGCTDLLKGY